MQKMTDFDFQVADIEGRDVLCLDPRQARARPLKIIEGEYREFFVEITANDDGELLFHFFPPRNRRFNVKFKKSMEQQLTKVMSNYPERLSFGKAEGVQRKGSYKDEAVDSYYAVIKDMDALSLLNGKDSFQRYVINPLEKISNSFIC